MPGSICNMKGKGLYLSKSRSDKIASFFLSRLYCSSGKHSYSRDHCWCALPSLAF